MCVWGGGGVSTDFIKKINQGSIGALTPFLTARGGYCKRIGIKGSSSLMFWNFFFVWVPWYSNPTHVVVYANRLRAVGAPR